MYRIKREARKNVVLVCTRCPHEIRVKDFDPAKGHPRTQAASKMLEHLSGHGITLLQMPPKEVMQRRWWT
jgi:hypothetical protein